jgi:hypothetical protein
MTVARSSGVTDRAESRSAPPGWFNRSTKPHNTPADVWTLFWATLVNFEATIAFHFQPKNRDSDA